MIYESSPLKQGSGNCTNIALILDLALTISSNTVFKSYIDIDRFIYMNQLFIVMI